MEKTKRAPYEAQIGQLIQTGSAKFLKEYDIYALLLESELTIHWQEAGRHRQAIDRLYPGMVLYPRPRRLSNGEKGLPEEEQKLLGINLKRNQVRVVHRFPDLWAAIRQRGRHIANNLIERRITINKEVEVLINGEAKRMAGAAVLINGFTNNFLMVRKITPQMEENFSQGILPIYQELEGAKDQFKSGAAELLKQALEERGIRRTAKLAEVAAKILERWVETLEIVENCLKQAESWLILCREIERKIEWSYKRLVQLAADLQTVPVLDSPFQVEKVRKITEELGGILVYLNQKVLFKPYYQRISSKEIQDLAKAKKYAKARRIKTVSNLINRALDKLGAIVFREKPTFAEVRQRRRALARG